MTCTPEMPHHAGTMKRIASIYLPSLASAVLLAWSFPTYHLHWLAWVALIPLLLRTAGFSPGRTALHFYICGHVFHTLTLQWLWANIFWAGGWAIIGQQCLVLILSLCWAATGFAWSFIHRRSSEWGGAFCLAGFWAGIELFESRAFSGFGWCSLGYTQGANLWVSQWAALGGVLLISFLIVLVNGLLALGIRYRRYRWLRLGAVPVALALIHVTGYLLLGEADYTSKPLQVGVIQPNFSQEMKWDPAYDYEMLQRTAQMTRTLAAQRPVDLAVWPEALIVRHFENPVFLESLKQTAVDTKAHIFTGAAREEYATSKSYNSSALVDPRGSLVGFYDKVHLAAFGEYVPFEKYLPFLRQIAFGGVDAGDKQVTFPVKDRTLGPLICFEVLFAPLAEKLRQAGADMLVVVTNLAWFGGSNAIPQELEIARMRAIETRLPLIHSSNTGISGVFDPYGRFSVVRYTVSPKNELLDWGDAVRPGHAVMRRFLGDFPLAAPAERPLPMGPVVAPWIALIVGILLAASTFLRWTPGPEDDELMASAPRTLRKPSSSKSTPSKPATPKPAAKPRSKKKTASAAPEQEELSFSVSDKKKQ